MAIQIISDLHLESPKAYDIFEMIPKAPHLALLGDIGEVVPHKDELFAFLRKQLMEFRTVLFVPGNHEAFGATWSAALDELRSFEQEVRSDFSSGEFVLLDRNTFILPGGDVTILGCRLFSHVPLQREMNVEIGLNDFFQITDWSVAAHNEAHSRDLEWLNERVRSLQNTSTKIVIFTHWSPTTDPRSVDPRHSGSAIASAFSTDLSSNECFQNGKVKLWAFGHTHYNCDFTATRGDGIEPLRLLTNQRGYYFAQAAGFDGETIIEQ